MGVFRKNQGNLLALTFVVLLVTQATDLANAKRNIGGSRKTGGGGYSTRGQPSGNTHVTKSYPTQAQGGSNPDLVKLSYSGNNAQPNVRPASAGSSQNGPPIGWNVPHQQGPPPAYSASNPIGGAKPNVYESPPAYRPNNAPPPSYGGNIHTPISPSNTHGVQSSYPGQNVPYGATYHSPGSSYYPGGHMPAGATYHPSGGVPAGATYLPAGAALPAGATYYSSPPQQSSSGLGFGSGLAAGAIGGALLGHVLTPTQTRVIEQAPANAGSSDGKVIIINNGQPGDVQEVNGTIIVGGAHNAAASAAAGAAAAPAAGAETPVPLAPMAPLPAGLPDNSTAPDAAQAPPAEPAPGGIICVPVRVNETDPADSTKMIEVEKVACYPAPPPPPPATASNDTVPLAPMEAGASDQNVQQLQHQPTQSTLLADNASVRMNGARSSLHTFTLGIVMSALLSALIARIVN